MPICAFPFVTRSDPLSFSFFPLFAGSDHDRFRFAKAAIAKRKQFAGRGAEESVVLAVGEGKGNLHISRKLRRKALWKVAK